MAKLNYRINQNIKAPEIRIIDQAGKQLGVMKTAKALGLAKEKGLDLVEVAPNAKPPVAKLLNFKRLVRERREQRKTGWRNAKTKVKEIRIRPNIGEADLNVRIKRAEGFLKKGKRVILSVVFRGREITHKEVGLEKVSKITDALREVAKAEGAPTRKGHRISVVLVPKVSESSKVSNINKVNKSMKPATSTRSIKSKRD